MIWRRFVSGHWMKMEMCWGFFNEPVQFEVKGVLELIGPKTVCLQGGMGGTYVKTTGQAGEGILTIENAQTGKICEHFQVAREE